VIFLTYDINCGKIIGVNKILYVSDKKSNDGHKLYHTQCVVCGYETDKRLSNIKVNMTCQHHIITQNGKENCINLKPKWKSKELREVFAQMKQRCYNPNCQDYKHYGAKGIKVCKEWEMNPEHFQDWAFKNGYIKGLTVDRINSDKNYCPENCRLITLEENSRFKTGTNIITINGITMSGRQWSKHLGKGVNYINAMIRKKGIDATITYIKSQLH